MTNRAEQNWPDDDTVRIEDSRIVPYIQTLNSPALCFVCRKRLPAGQDAVTKYLGGGLTIACCIECHYPGANQSTT
jgi:hypothetical protein